MGGAGRHWSLCSLYWGGNVRFWDLKKLSQSHRVSSRIGFEPRSFWLHVCAFNQLDERQSAYARTPFPCSACYFNPDYCLSPCLLICLGSDPGCQPLHDSQPFFNLQCLDNCLPTTLSPWRPHSTLSQCMLHPDTWLSWLYWNKMKKGKG